MVPRFVRFLKVDVDNGIFDLLDLKLKLLTVYDHCGVEQF